MAALLVVYVTRPAAPLCERVCDYLDAQGYEYEMIDVVSDQDRAAMTRRTGYSTCPLVVVGDRVIGKLEETIVADRTGVLAEVLRKGE
jgi:glutaredoxin